MSLRTDLYDVLKYIFTDVDVYIDKVASKIELHGTYLTYNFLTDSNESPIEENKILNPDGTYKIQHVYNQAVSLSIDCFAEDVIENASLISSGCDTCQDILNKLQSSLMNNTNVKSYAETKNIIQIKNFGSIRDIELLDDDNFYYRKQTEINLFYKLVIESNDVQRIETADIDGKLVDTDGNTVTESNINWSL